MAYPQFYYLFYAGFLLLLLPYFLFRGQKTNRTLSITFSVLLIVVVSCYFGLRGSYGSDTDNYLASYRNVSQFSFLKDYLAYIGNTDIFFYSIFYLLYPRIPLSIFFCFIPFLFLGSYILLASNWYKEELFPLLVCLVGLFFVFQLGTNIIRSAFALALFFLFLHFREGKRKIAWLFLLLAILSHITILIMVIAYFCSRIIKQTWLYYCIWGIALLLAVSQIGILDIPVIKSTVGDSEKFRVYLKNTFGYRTGFRLDFTLFNFIFVLLGYFAYRRRHTPFYFRMYLLLGSIFLLWYQLPFSDRIGLYSWLFIPFIVTDFSRMNLFKNRHINYWVFYFFTLFLGLISVFLISKS